MARVLGIDLGTFNSCVSVMDAGAPVIIANSHGYQTMPSMVAVTESGRRVVGHIAKRQAITNAENTILAAKRLIGRRFQSTQVQRMKDAVAYRIVEGPHDDPRVVQRGRVLTVPEVSAMILQELKLVAERYLGEEVERAVVTVPAYFNDNQRQATKDAGAIAGLDVIHIVNEPTAAALAYGFGKQIDRTLAVYDLGGGTFDISILEISSSGVFKVVSTAGDTFLGGEDFDQRLVDWLGVDFEERTGIDVRTDRIAMQRLRDACEKAKCQLSTVSEVEINLPFLISDGRGEAVHLQTMLTRAQLEELTEDLIARTIAICETTLEEAGLDKDEIEDVLLVGGMTRMPAVEAAVTGFFEREPSANVDPDLVVAMGAAVQGAALTEDEHDMVLLDVTPHTLGIVVAGGWMEEIIPQNSTVPIARAKTFTTTRDEQTTVKLMVVQGESRRADENELLGEFALTGLRSARAGEVGLEVSFELDMDGIVSVRAADLETGKEQRIQITASSGLTEDELRGLIDEGRDHAVARRADQKLDEARSQAETLISEIEALRPKVEAAAAGTSFGESAVKNALEMIEKTQQEIERGDAIAVERALEPLRRTLRLFKGASAAG